MGFQKCMVLAYLVLSGMLALGQCPGAPGSGCDPSSPLDLYWVGSDADHNGDWNDPCAWRVGSTSGVEPCQAPRSFDNVFFTAAGFSGSTSAQISMVTQSRCLDLTVDPDVNGLAITPMFYMEDPGYLDVYGSFTLQTNIEWEVDGGRNGPELNFKAVTTGTTISSAGHKLGSVSFDGLGGEWTLQDDINIKCLEFVFGHLITDDHEVSVLTFTSTIEAGALNTNRILDLGKSTFIVRGSHSQNRYSPYTNWQNPGNWEAFDSDTTNTDFRAENSTLVFNATNAFIHIGALRFNKIEHTGTGRFYSHFSADPTYIDTFETNGFVFFHQSHTFNVFQLNTPGLKHDFFHHQWINTDFIVTGDDCYPTVLSSEYNRYLHLPDVISSTMDGFHIENLRCTTPLGGAVNVLGYATGTTTGWSISSPGGRNLYWVGNTSNNWNTPSNWSSTADGLTLLDDVLDCPPSQVDNVYFTSPLTDGDNVYIDDEAFCHDMNWNITAAATFSGSSNLHVYGSLAFDEDMTMSNTSNIYMYGVGDTYFSAGQRVRSMYFQDDSDYSLLADMRASSIVYFFRHDNFNSGGYSITANSLRFRGNGTTDLSGSTLTLSGTSPWYIAGSQSNVIYDNNTHAYFTNANRTMINGFGDNVHLPNLTQQNSTAEMDVRDHLRGRDILIEGDATFNGSVRFYAEGGSGSTDGPLGQITIEGDLNLAADQTYEIGVDDTLVVKGDVHAIGACASEMVVIQGIFGVPFLTRFEGAINFKYVILGNSVAVGAGYTVTDCVDLGGNTNWTISPPTSTDIYYWRAANGSCPSCVYSASWNSEDNWTTNQLATEGGAGCIPGPTDVVIFDSISFDGASSSSIDISGVVSCHDVISTTSDISITGDGNLYLTGSMTLDGTFDLSSFTGKVTFASSDPLGETIQMGGTTIDGEVHFSSEYGSWTLLDALEISGELNLKSGAVYTNGEDLTVNNFRSSNTRLRTLDLGSSTFSITGSGWWTDHGSSANIYTWHTNNSTNFTFVATDATIDMSGTSSPVFHGGDLNYGRVLFSGTGTSIGTSPVLSSKDATFRYLQMNANTRMFNDNTYDTLHFTPGNTYVLEEGTTQTIKAPDGTLIATGTGGNEIAIVSSVNNSDAYFYKDNTGGSQSSFCLDYLSVRDNEASSNDPVFSFFVGFNSDNVGGSSTGIWDFTRPVFVTPALTAPSDQIVCDGSDAYVTFDLNGSGPHFLTYEIGGVSGDTSLPNGTTSITLSANITSTTTFEITNYEADNCGTRVSGTVIDDTHEVTVVSPIDIALDSDSATCSLSNQNSFVHFTENNGSGKPVVSILDHTGGVGLGNVTATVRIMAEVDSINEVPYLQRYIGISPQNEELATIRLYFTTAEMAALSTAFGTTLAHDDLIVTKFDNHQLDMTGDRTELTVVASGNASAVTGDPDTWYIDVQTSTFSTFFIHPVSTILPVELVKFTAIGHPQHVDLHWATLTEVNSDYFDLEHSLDAVSWQSIGQVQASGNSLEPQHYFFRDEEPRYSISSGGSATSSGSSSSGVAYYRIKMVDLDGSFDYSPIEPVQHQPTSGTASISPNPNNGSEFSLQFDGPISGASIWVSIHDMTGRLRFRREISGVTGKSSLQLQMGQPLPPGYYTLSISSVDLLEKLLMCIKH